MENQQEEQQQPKLIDDLPTFVANDQTKFGLDMANLTMFKADEDHQQTQQTEQAPASESENVLDIANPDLFVIGKASENYVDLEFDLKNAPATTDSFITTSVADKQSTEAMTINGTETHSQPAAEQFAKPEMLINNESLINITCLENTSCIIDTLKSDLPEETFVEDIDNKSQNKSDLNSNSKDYKEEIVTTASVAFEPAEPEAVVLLPSKDTISPLESPSADLIGNNQSASTVINGEGAGNDSVIPLESTTETLITSSGSTELQQQVLASDSSARHDEEPNSQVLVNDIPKSSPSPPPAVATETQAEATEPKTRLQEQQQQSASQSSSSDTAIEPLYTTAAATTTTTTTMGRKNRRENSSDEAFETESGPDRVKEYIDNVLGPNALSLLYWRDPMNTGIVFGIGLVILLSLTIFSVISVVAYTLLFTLLGTLSFRIYKNVMQAVNKTNDGHPFKEYFEIEIAPPQERIHEIVDSVVAHGTCFIKRMQSVLLVENLVDSLKYLLIFWALTYIGACFNGLTVIILLYLSAFSLPIVYEQNKAQIDQYLDLVSSKISEISDKVPFLKKVPTDKED